MYVYMHMCAPLCIFVAFWWVGMVLLNYICACMCVYAYKGKELDKKYH